jgi:hypothetical protein
LIVFPKNCISGLVVNITRAAQRSFPSGVSVLKLSTVTFPTSSLICWTVGFVLLNGGRFPFGLNVLCLLSVVSIV